MLVGGGAAPCNRETINNTLGCCLETCTLRKVEDEVAGGLLIMHRTGRKWPVINISAGAKNTTL